MHSPRFKIRSKHLTGIFTPSNIEKIWTKKVRLEMRNQYIQDGVEHFDLHVARKTEFQKLSELVLSGNYVPQKPQRILVEKSKGLCRQIVIPSTRDALVLQCLSDALYQSIHANAPTSKAFYKPKDHSFSSEKNTYGTFSAWLDFQKELFNFTKNRNFVIVTDISNYYDSISYNHLRNSIASIAGVKSPVLDMLIFVLSDLLWQPDYSPRIEIGLPQIDMDAPRLLAHCFLYELDELLDEEKTLDFVRFMDDIDVGVDQIHQAKKILRDMDLVLQTKHIRLNSGKTKILSREQAIKHFCIVQNAALDALEERVKKAVKSGSALKIYASETEKLLSQWAKAGIFDQGNGEKILKRLLKIAWQTKAKIPRDFCINTFISRPSTREMILQYLSYQSASSNVLKTLDEIASSSEIIDQATHIEIANYLVETFFNRKNKIIHSITQRFDPKNATGLYCVLIMASRFQGPAELLKHIQKNRSIWFGHQSLGRLIGSFQPLFEKAPEYEAYKRTILSSRNEGAWQTHRFQIELSKEEKTLKEIFRFLKSPNPTKGTSITHPKFLLLLSALKNKGLSKKQRDFLKLAQEKALNDAYYKSILKRCSAA